MKEQDIQSQILKYLSSIGYARKVSAYLAGTPDVIAVINGKFYAFEIKRNEKSKVSDLQKWNIEEINRNGGNAYVVFSLEQVKDIINATDGASDREK